MAMKKLRIGFFVDAFFPTIDGVIQVVNQYASRLSEIAEVIVFAPNANEKNYVDQFPYQVIRSINIKVLTTEYFLSLPRLDNDFMKALKNSNLDIVHIHSPFTMGQLGLNYAKKHKIPVIASLHSQYKRDFLERTKSKVITDIAIKEIIKVFNQCDRCYAVNPAVALLYIDYGLKHEPGIFRNATEMYFEQGHDLVDDINEKYHLKDIPTLLFVGRIDKVKNIMFIAEVLHELKKLNFDFQFMMVGDGPDKKEWLKKITSYQLNDRIILTGKVRDRKELAAINERSDLFVFPSLYDTNSLVQIEAASQKTPSIFLKGAVTAYDVIDQVNGYFSTQEPKQFAQDIIQIFQNQEQLKAVSERAYQDLYHTWEEVVQYAYTTYEYHIELKKGVHQ
jgi:1,2-diacylglycerol 3-alpha-glucosyltransferase